jgi:D-alanyl-D-alanine carboxypeptidase
MNRLRLTHPLITGAGTLFLALVAFVSGVSAVSILNMANQPQTSTAAVAAAFPTPLSLDPNTLLAQAAIVYDPTTNTTLYEKNATTPLPLASLTKLITATAILNNNPGDPSIHITKTDLLPDGDPGDWGFAQGDDV